MKNLFAKALFAVVLTIATAVQTMAQQSFSYQAVIRNAEGELVTNQKVGLKFSLLNGGKAYYTETQTADVNEYGNISVEIGKGTRVGDGKFSDVPWNTLDVTLRVEVDPTGGKNYQLLGETKISPAPYAMYATQGGGGAIANGASKDNGNLFEVTDRDGNPVFAVTNDGIVVYVDDTETGDKARRSGFVVTGRTATKNGDGDLFAVTAEGTQVYVDEQTNDKARRSGFVVTGRTATKSNDGDLFAVNDEGTRVYVDDPDNGNDKARRSGFIVTGRTATKDTDADIFAVDAATTTVYVEDGSGNDKARRSGFVVTGRTATKDGNIVDINSSRTNLTTATLSIANSAANEEGPASTALQLTETAVTMNSDMAMEGGLRPALDVDKNEEYNIYISDNEDDDPDGFDRIYIYDNFSFDPYEMVNGYYYWLASFHDTLVVPLTSQESILMLNSNGEETAIPQDACVAVFFPDRYSDYINVWPLRKLDNFKVSFALTDYDISYGAILGYADEYARLNVTISSKAAYPGCWLYLGGPQVYTAKVETSQGTFEVETGGNYNKEYRAVLGETVTLAVTAVPDGQVFDSWRCNGRRYTDSVLHLPITQVENDIYPVFKDESPVLWVESDFKPTDENVTLDGSENAPYGTIAEALSRIIEEQDNTLRGFRINVKNEAHNAVINIDESLDNRAKHITIDFISRSDDDKVIGGINVSTVVPVIVRNASVVATTNGDAVKLSGKRLTLDGCNVSKNANTVCGLNVEKGELVMIGGTVSNCNNRGAYVAKGAILSLKNGAEISENTVREGAGGGIYLCGGATLNVNNSNINENNEVYAAGECSFNVIGGESYIGKVGLADGAFVTRNIEDVYEPRQITLSTIENPSPDRKVAEIVGSPYWGQEEMENKEWFFNQLFIINDENLLDSDYSKYLKFEGNIGKPFITKKIYTKGTISFTNSDPVLVLYTYYRNDNEDEYLRLKYEYSSGETKYQNYWFVDNGEGKKLYRDTTYICEDGEDPMPFEVEDGFFEPVESPGNPLAVTEFFVPDDYTDDYTLNGDGDIVLQENQNYPVMRKEKNIVVECSRAILFTKNLGNLMDLLEFESYDAFSSLMEDPYSTKFGDDVYFSDDADDFRNYSQWEIEEHFDKLRNGFDVTIMALGGSVTCGDKTYTDTVATLEGVKYGTKLTLEVEQGENEFIGWSDGDDEATGSRDFYIRGDVEIMPIFKQSEFTVSADGVYKSINMVGKYLENSLYTSDDNVTIKVKGTVKGPQTLSDKINVGSITIDGADGDNPNGVLDARRRGSSVLTINTTSPVTIQNLTITGGGTYEEYGVDINGGGVYVSENATVTLADGALIAGNNATLGGGVYNKGALFMYGSAIIGDKTTTQTADLQNYSNRAAVGGGIYNDGGAVYLGYKTETEEQELTGGIYYNYSASKGAGSNYQSGDGGGIFNNGEENNENSVIKMSSGNISYNGGRGYGAGIFNKDYAKAEMTGGKISNNKGHVITKDTDIQYGGGVRVCTNSLFKMTGGEISGNTANNGGGVSITGTFEMYGGVIKDNEVEKNDYKEHTAYGKGIYFERGELKICGSAYVAEGNDIYLYDPQMHAGTGTNIITIAGKLTPPDAANGIVATITPETYAASAQVLKYELADGQTGTTLADERGKFAVMPDEENNNYTVGYDGELMTLYKISNAEQLEDLFSRMNEQEISTENIYISIENNLELTNHVPFEVEVRINENDWKTVGFKGVFDGNGHTITIESFDKSKTWGNNMKNVNTLVCYRNEGIIQNVIVDGACENKSIASGEHVDAGGLCYCNAGGIVRNCWNKMSFDLKILHQTGGICAVNEGLIENCINTGTIKAEFNANNWEGVYALAGGICGENMTSDPDVHTEGEIKNCVNYGQVEIKTTNKNNTTLNGAGGAICASNGQESSKQGATYPTIEYCYWLENCVKTGSDISTATNYMVYNDSRVRFGTASHCNYIDSRNDGIAVLPGSAELCGNEQNYQDGPDLDENLNTYVDNTNNGVLKRWVKIQEGSNYIVVLNFND